MGINRIIYSLSNNTYTVQQLNCIFKNTHISCSYMNYIQKYIKKQNDESITFKQIKLSKKQDVLRLEQQVKDLSKIISPEQRTPEWFALRNNKITASDGGCVMGVNYYEHPYKFIVKKLTPSSFTGTFHTHHGKKYERIATSIYEHKYNVEITEFGLLEHPTYTFLGASPDGIVTKCSKPSYTGRMLEIKCPKTRKILQPDQGTIYEVCPEYYWVQVQLQLECCDLDVCDFWQCDLVEEYNSDAYYKGCLIELMPIKYENTDIKDTDIYEHASYIYPKNVCMTLDECGEWIKIQTIPEGKYLHRILHWHLNNSSCLTIMRDKEWFKNALPKLSKTWQLVEYLRNQDNETKRNLFLNYANNNTKGKKFISKETAEDIYKFAELLPSTNINDLSNLRTKQPSVYYF